MAGLTTLNRVILAGGGHAHLAVLADWARQPLPGTERMLVTRARHLAYSGMIPGWMTGRYAAQDLLIDLEPLAARAEARLVLGEVTGLDAAAQQVRLHDGTALDFDLLSLATGGEIAPTIGALPAATVLPVRPIEAFMAGWSRFLESGATGPVMVLGGGAAGVELAFAARSRGCDVTLVVPPDGFLPGHGRRARSLAAAVLTRAGVAVADSPDGKTAAFAIVATGTRPPAWLGATGLALDAAEFVEVGPDLRSRSHPAVFAAGDIAAPAGLDLPRAGIHAVKSGPVLAANLRAALRGESLQPYRPGRRSLALLATGDGRAIASWGSFAAEGRWLYQVKDRIDRGFIARYR